MSGDLRSPPSALYHAADLVLPAPDLAFRGRKAPLLAPPGQPGLGEGAATDPKAHHPGTLDLAQNSAGQTSWRRLGMAFTDSLIPQ